MIETLNRIRFATRSPESGMEPVSFCVPAKWPLRSAAWALAADSANANAAAARVARPGIFRLVIMSSPLLSMDPGDDTAQGLPEAGPTV